MQFSIRTQIVTQAIVSLQWFSQSCEEIHFQRVMVDMQGIVLGGELQICFVTIFGGFFFVVKCNFRFWHKSCLNLKRLLRCRDDDGGMRHRFTYYARRRCMMQTALCAQWAPCTPPVCLCTATSGPEEELQASLGASLELLRTLYEVQTKWERWKELGDERATRSAVSAHQQSGMLFMHRIMVMPVLSY